MYTTRNKKDANTHTITIACFTGIDFANVFFFPTDTVIYWKVDKTGGYGRVMPRMILHMAG
jgi:hypothetical protein